jgi:hypothetical protein
MRLDGYAKVVLTAIAVALVALAARAWLDLAPWGGALRVTAAEAQGRPAEYDITIPKAWGKVVFYGGGNFVFEDKDGILREADVRGRPPEYPKLKSIVRRAE